jgi:hypothetical protein
MRSLGAGSADPVNAMLSLAYAILSGRTKAPAISLHNERVAERHLTAAALSEFFRQQPNRFARVRELLTDWSTPAFASSVREFLREAQGRLVKSLIETFPPEMCKQLGLKDDHWIERVAGRDSRLALAEIETASDFRRVDRLEHGAREAGQYQQAAWAQRRKRTIEDEDVLSFLSRKAVIPNTAFRLMLSNLTLSGRGHREVLR